MPFGAGRRLRVGGGLVSGKVGATSRGGRRRIGVFYAPVLTSFLPGLGNHDCSDTPDASRRRVCDHVALRRTFVTTVAMATLTAVWLLQAGLPVRAAFPLPTPDPAHQQLAGPGTRTPARLHPDVARPFAGQTPPAQTPPPPAAPSPTPAPQPPDGSAARGGASPAPGISAESLLARNGPPVIILDPGHGGDDAGAKGAGGAQEKQLTLDIARRLKSLLEMRLGVRVMLTRESDVAVPLDTRVAFANNHKGDLFLSLHMNAAPLPAVEGSEVYYLQLDRAGEQARASAGKTAVAVPTIGGGTRTLELIPWELAQARHLDASAMLADALAASLGARLPAGPSPIRRAPLRVLEGVNMPAALVELAFLSSPAQEKQALTNDFKDAAAQALFDAVSAFRQRDETKAR